MRYLSDFSSACKDVWCDDSYFAAISLLDQAVICLED